MTTLLNTTFKEQFLTSALNNVGVSEWGDWDSRQGRYRLLWSYYEGSAYRNIHTWARRYKDSFGLDRYVRDLFNPMSALGSVYESYVWGGWLDPTASNNPQSALPIETENENLRLALATLWRASQWTTQRNIIPLRGSVIGDVFISVVDNPARGDVYLQRVDAETIATVEKDGMGNVKAYTKLYRRPDDINPLVSAEYKEVVSRDGDDVVYQLYKNGELYPWGGDVAEWAIPYGFVPMVHIQHHDIGRAWGMAEGHPSLPLFREVDETMSRIGDKVGQQLNAPVLFAGMQEPVQRPNTGAPNTLTTPQDAGKDQIPTLYAPDPAAKAQFLVADLPLAEALEVVKAHQAELERRYPELAIGNGEGGVRSGTAEQERHRAAENKIQERRANYDAGLVKAQQMAVAIGGWRQYPSYEPFSLNSYDAGELDHSIAYRDVFRRDDTTQIAIATMRATGIKTMVDAGANLKAAAIMFGLTEEEAQALIEVEYGMAL
jgi:hypothetical protein